MPVTRFIAYRGADRVLAGGQIAEIRRRHADAPAAIRTDGAGVSHAIKRDGYRLPASAVLLPLMVGGLPASAAFRISSVAMVLMANVGAVASTL